MDKTSWTNCTIDTMNIYAYLGSEVVNDLVAVVQLVLVSGLLRLKPRLRLSDLLLKPQSAVLVIFLGGFSYFNFANFTVPFNERILHLLQV